MKHGMKKRSIALLLSGVLALGLLGGCGSEGGQQAEGSTPPADESAPQTQLEKIVITEPARGFLWAPIYLAQTLGYFEEEGLTAEFQTVTGGDPGAVVFSGEAQFGLRGVEMPLSATQAGQGCKILASTTATYPYILMGASEEFSTVESLRGQVVAGSTPSGSLTAWVNACLAYGGLDPETDVEMVMIQGNGQIAAMANGEIAACCGNSSWAVKQEIENGAVPIIDGTDPEVFKEIMGSETYEMYILFASDEYIASNPETCQKVVNGVVKAMNWMKTASAEEITEGLMPLFEGREEEVLYCVQDAQETNLYSYTGYHTESGYDAALKLAKLCGLIEEDIPAETIYDESFLDNAWAEIGQ